jgi:hypothetical protein
VSIKHFEIVTSYIFNSSFHLDDAAAKAIGRVSDFSGAGIDGKRDLGWVAKSKFDANRMKRALDKIGLHATIREPPETPVFPNNCCLHPDACTCEWAKP